jgi:hypothetical protein
MLLRRAPRLMLEVAFLAALAAALSFADVRAYAIVAVMAAGWVIAAVFEWGALRSRPHYGSGLPPRWYLPRVELPPPRPLEQFAPGYPAAEAPADAPTWIAPPSLLAEWPVADVAPRDKTPLEEQTGVYEAPDAALVVAVDQPDEVVPASEPAPEEEERELEREPAAEAALQPQPQRAPRARPAGARMARHRIDPLAPPPAKARRFGHRTAQAGFDAEVPDGPMRRSGLPAQRRSN